MATSTERIILQCQNNKPMSDKELPYCTVTSIQQSSAFHVSDVFILLQKKTENTVF
jgi:hypothetical protein